ncbi:MAG TPA: hypothetical protein VGL05_18880 [Kribbella sp.]
MIALVSTAMQYDHPMSDPLTMIAMSAAFWWFGLGRPVVWLTADELVVRNPLRTHRIARGSVVSAQPGRFGVVIVRRDGRPCTAFALFKPRNAEERAAGLITYWSQTPPSSNQGEVLEGPYAEERERRRVVDLLAAAGLAIVLTIPAVLLAWPHNPQWLWPVAGLIMIIAIAPFGTDR